MLFNQQIWNEAKMPAVHCSVPLFSELEICTLCQKWMPSPRRNLDFFLLAKG